MRDSKFYELVDIEQLSSVLQGDKPLQSCVSTSFFINESGLKIDANTGDLLKEDTNIDSYIYYGA